MFRALRRLVMAALIVCGALFVWQHFHPAKASPVAEAQSAEPETKPADPQDKPYVAITGPLAKLVGQKKPAPDADDQGPVTYKASARDHIEDSPVGTSARIVHRTFAVARLVHVPFEVPPHATMPHFHGTFSSFAQSGGAPSHDEDANVDLLLMNEQQYAEFSAGRDPDVLLVADTSHYQDINFDLSPSRDQPVKYHLVFRNSPGGPAKKVVKADFTVDF